MTMKRVYNMKSGVWKEEKEVKNDKNSHQIDFKGVPTSYKELQSLAKEVGIPANQSKDDLIYQINDYLKQK